MYFTIKYLAPEKYVPVIAWIDGMCLSYYFGAVSADRALPPLPSVPFRLEGTPCEPRAYLEMLTIRT